MFAPVYFSKFYAPLALLFLGLGAWAFFRQLKLGPVACVLGSLATMLNSIFFSAACWGVGPQEIAFGSGFLAMAAVLSKPPRWSWLRFPVAGLAVGLAVMEGSDFGALISLMVAAFTLYAALVEEGTAVPKVARGIGRVALVAVFAALVAAQTLNGLISTNIKGIAGAQQDAQTKAAHWNWATQWSLPKSETLGLLVPGLFGYRMDSPDGGNYWGSIGRDPSWDAYFKSGEQSAAGHGFLRQVGGGNYLGVLVILIGLWAVLQSLRRSKSVFEPRERKMIWFWAGCTPILLLLAYGRFAPFYRIVYGLPYVSTIRSPAKFVDFIGIAVLVLFAFGVNGLTRRYVQTSAAGGAQPGARLKGASAPDAAFNRRWIIGCLAAIGVSLVGWWIYSHSRQSLELYLEKVQLGGQLGQDISAFSIRQVGWFILFLAAAVAATTFILRGGLAGKRLRWAGILLGVVLVADLGRADLPWIKYWNYKQKYASNPVIDFLRQKPYEHRVAILPFQPPREVGMLTELYRIEWAQHQFQYYNVQSLDIVQMSRTPEDYVAFESALHFDGTPRTLYRLARRWELTNTRYLLGPAGYLQVLNQQVDPVLHRFRIAELFDIVPKPGVANPTRYEQLTAEPSSSGPYALFEFTGALPRARLYGHWKMEANDPAALSSLKKPLTKNEVASLKQFGTNDYLTLKELAAPSFDPSRLVLLDTPVPTTAKTADTTNAPADPGTVEFTSYAPKDIKLRADAKAPAILLLNDRYDPDWQVRVDGKQAELLRCNYVMRGVYLRPGSHQVEFVFRPPVRLLYVSLGAIGAGLVLVGLTYWGKRKTASPAPQSAGKPDVADLVRK